MIASVLLRVFVVLLLVAVNAFFAAAEFALVSVRETRIQQLIEAHRVGARTVLKLHQQLSRVVNGVQLGITITSLTLGWLGRAACVDLRSCHRRSGSLRDDHQPARNPRRTGSEVARLATGGAGCTGSRRAHGRFSHHYRPPDPGHEPRRWFCSARIRHPRNPPRLSPFSRRTQAHRDRRASLRPALFRPGRDAAECARTRQHHGASSDGAADQNLFLAFRPEPGRSLGASGR
ncbi:exported hypothetical protein [Candidatus Sulfotelmatobacter sp. SbA7]|nr:exported hypothetical protein [Candidatus Sulfotelmatobacter sp. SbA7]